MFSAGAGGLVVRAAAGDRRRPGRQGREEMLSEIEEIIEGFKINPGTAERI